MKIINFEFNKKDTVNEPVTIKGDDIRRPLDGEIFAPSEHKMTIKCTIETHCGRTVYRLVDEQSADESASEVFTVTLQCCFLMAGGVIIVPIVNEHAAPFLTWEYALSQILAFRPNTYRVIKKNLAHKTYDMTFYESAVQRDTDYPEFEMDLLMRGS